MTTTVLLTAPRRRALEVLAATHPRPARVSNTTARTAGVALVYWQSADWLTAEGLARVTDAGVIACKAAEIEVRS